MAATLKYYATPVDGNQLLVYAQQTVVNTVNPNSTSSVNFAVPAADPPNTATIVNVTLPSSELVNALISAAVQAMQVPNWSEYPGQYTPNVAKLMAYYGSWTRGGLDVGQYYIIGAPDIYNLLAQDPTVQEMWVNAALRGAGFEGISGNNGVPLVQKGVSQILVPSKEQLKAQLPPGTALTEIGTEQEVPPPEGLETVGAKKDDDNNWWLYGGIAAAGVAAYTVYAMVKRGRR